MWDHVGSRKSSQCSTTSPLSGLTSYACTSHIAHSDMVWARRALGLDFQLTYCKRQRSTRAGGKKRKGEEERGGGTTRRQSWRMESARLESLFGWLNVKMRSVSAKSLTAWLSISRSETLVKLSSALHLHRVQTWVVEWESVGSGGREIDLPNVLLPNVLKSNWLVILVKTCWHSSTQQKCQYHYM